MSVPIYLGYFFRTKMVTKSGTGIYSLKYAQNE